MVNSEAIYHNIIKIMDDVGADYKLFSHRKALSYNELEEIQKEVGFFGDEGKCLVLKGAEKPFVYVTLSGKKIDFKKVAERIGVPKVKMISPEELINYFGAEPGCAYPFGFSEDTNIFIDPQIYKIDWFLFSPCLPIKTVQIRGIDLKKVFTYINNKIEEVDNFNL